jgi:tetratricopeptide (TPR) repeat protein
MRKKPAEAARYFSRAVERDPKYLVAVNEFIFALATSGQVGRARGVLGEYLAKEPKNPLVWEMSGRFHLALQKSEEAEGAFLKAIELDPESPKPYYELGIMYSSQKKFPEAEEKLKKVVEKDEKNGAALTMLGVVLQSRGKIEDANRNYRRALEIDPKNALAGNNLASNLADYGGNLDEAIRFAQNAKDAAPENPVIRDTLGWIYYKKGLYESAFPLVSDAARKLEKNAVVRYHHGMVLARTGKNREAARELTAALSLDPDFPGAAEARNVLKTLKEVELSPESPQSLYELGVKYASQKKFAEAEEKLKKVVEKDEKNVAAITMLGVVLQSGGKVEDANRHYRRALEIAPKNALAARNLASNLSDHGGNLDEAIRFAQVAQVADPRDPAVQDTLGWLYYKKGLYESALPLVSDAARKLEKNAVVRYHHGMVLAKTGKNKEAARELTAALSLDRDFPGATEAKNVLKTLK